MVGSDKAGRYYVYSFYMSFEASWDIEYLKTGQPQCRKQGYTVTRTLGLRLRKVGADIIDQLDIPSSKTTCTGRSGTTIAQKFTLCKH